MLVFFHQELFLYPSVTEKIFTVHSWYLNVKRRQYLKEFLLSRIFKKHVLTLGIIEQCVLMGLISFNRFFLSVRNNEKSEITPGSGLVWATIATSSENHMLPSV